jgi:Zn-dependent peptidase ImmA (M78 family)
MRDFRRIGGSDSGEWSVALHDEFHRANLQRDYALELLGLEELDPKTNWKVAGPIDDDDELAILARNELLEVSPLVLPTARNADVYGHLNVWITALEEAGVLVHATAGGNVEVSEMRAFSLYFDALPVIVVNGADAPRGRLFSLLHEYAHLLLHTSGLCDAITDQRATSVDRRLEARCNAIAAAVLMPTKSVLEMSEVRGRPHETDWTFQAFSDAASVFGVSVEAFIIRLVTLGVVSNDYYSRWRENNQSNFEGNGSSSPQSQGGNWYRNKARDLGKGFVRSVASAWDRHVIDSATASTYLDAKVSQIRGLAEVSELSGRRR